MTISEYLLQQEADRRPTLGAIHEIILKNDPKVTPVIGSMMGKEMIMYTCGIFKYGLASVKGYMSLHCMPIYMNPPLHTKYMVLLSGAKFQKGCINFKNAAEMPAEIIAQLISDCAKIDIVAIRDNYLADRKKKK